MPSSSRSSCTVPSSPSWPCSATNATSGAGRAEALDEVGADVDRDDVVAEALERVRDARAGAQRDVALQRLPALEHGDAVIARRRRGVAAARRRAGVLGCGGSPRPAGVARGRSLAGQRRVQADLLVDDLADPPHALADVVLGDAGEVEPHRGAATAVEDTRRGRGRTPRSPAAPGPAGRSCRCSDGSVAQMNSPPSGRVNVRLGAAGAPRAPRAAGRAGAGRARSASPRSGASRAGRKKSATKSWLNDDEHRSAALLAEVHLLEHGPRRRRPADPQARRQDLRERAEVDHVLAAVERVQRRQRRALVAQQAVRVVLEDQQLALRGDLDQPPPPLERQGDARPGSGSSGRCR